MTDMDKTSDQVQKKLKILAFCGITAPILFMLLVIMASLLRLGYSQTYNFISDLGVGPYALIQNINFVIFGLLSIALSFGLRISLPAPQGKAFKAGVWLVIIFGLGVLFAGVFPEDYGSGALHTASSATAFVSIIAAQLLIWKGLKDRDRTLWGFYPKYSLISGLLSFVLLIVLRVAIFEGSYPGLAQRVFLLVPWIWIGLTGLKLYFLSKKIN